MMSFASYFYFSWFWWRPSQGWKIMAWGPTSSGKFCAIWNMTSIHNHRPFVIKTHVLFQQFDSENDPRKKTKVVLVLHCFRAPYHVSRAGRLGKETLFISSNYCDTWNWPGMEIDWLLISAKMHIHPCVKTQKVILPKGSQNDYW